MNKLVYWIWLSLACTPDTPTFAKLIAKFTDAEEIYCASERDIRGTVGQNVSDVTRLNDKDLSRASKIYEFCTKLGVGILIYADENYPVSLRNIETPPVLLYYRGTLPDFNAHFRCGIVGTRKLTDSGRINAFRFGYNMAKATAIVVSGMATGIDGVAMAGALCAGGTVVAVMGSGIDVCYPLEHKRLARETVKRGCVLTEYAPGTKPFKQNFPKRNRIISALSSVVVVVEGNERSGALITARYAKAQGIPVYAFPGNVLSDSNDGSNQLLRNGAKVCLGAEDIVSDFENDYHGKLNPSELTYKLPIDMMDVFREYQVSCVTPTDDIFKQPRVKKAITRVKNSFVKREHEPVQIRQEQEQIVSTPPPTFDKDAVRLYKKIPLESDVAIDELIDDEFDFKTVARLLLKLEMSRFVSMLPGDRVKRI